MSDEALVSYAQNGEDIVLWRALQHVRGGQYVDVGGWDPDQDSVTRLFHERGWRGVDVEPVPEFAAKFRDRRPHNQVVQAVVTDQPVDSIVLHRFGTSGLSTIDDDIARRHDATGLDNEDIVVPARRLDDILDETTQVGQPIHFLKIDVEGAEAAVVRSIDLARWRPWVLVIEATEPNSSAQTHHEWEPLVLAAGYRLTLFDGLSRFYVSPEHPELEAALSYPACAIDDYVPVVRRDLEARVDDLDRELARANRDALRWRNQAVVYWSDAMAKAQGAEGRARDAEVVAARLQAQVARVRGNLKDARADRGRLKERVARLTSRVEKQAARIAELEGAGAGSASTTKERVRAAVRAIRS